jgi:hypothetical protein
VKAIVDTFRTGTWKDKSEQLILAVQASLADTKVQDEIEAQATALKAEGITFVPRGGEELSEILKDRPEVVDDFFGRDGSKPFSAWMLDKLAANRQGALVGGGRGGAEPVGRPDRRCRRHDHSSRCPRGKRYKPIVGTPLRRRRQTCASREDGPGKYPGFSKEQG